jgi:hypothetical protein
VKEDECSRQPTIRRTDDNIAAVDKMVKEDRKVTSRVIAETLGIPKAVVLWILKEDMKKRQSSGAFGSNNSTVSDSKTSRNIEPHPISPDLSAPDYLFFPKVKLQLKGVIFDKIERIKKP